MATRRRPTERDDPQGPWVQLAAFCDQVIIDKTDTLTLVRVIDQITLGRPRGRKQDARRRLWIGALAVGLRAGEVYGTGEITLVMVNPTGKRATIGQLSVTFDDAVRAMNIAQRVQLQFRTEGLYWLDVSYAGRLLTRMPLSVRYQPAPAPEQDPSSSASPP
jgi:hypothetical protein